jgi:hypothetical protein
VPQRAPWAGACSEASSAFSPGVGALAIPGIGPIIAGGALASTLAGAGIGAAAGGLIGALVGMGVPEEDAKHFERGFQEGAVLVTVLAGADGEEARDVIVAAAATLVLPTPRAHR